MAELAIDGIKFNPMLHAKVNSASSVADALHIEKDSTGYFEKKLRGSLGTQHTISSEVCNRNVKPLTANFLHCPSLAYHGLNRDVLACLPHLSRHPHDLHR